MIKVRIKRAPKTGDQEDYALVQNNNPSLGNSANKRVKNTMTAIPRKEANVEVEGGETVVGDVNQDGLLELMSFSGKRHSEGGMPVNLPNGAFIFSDTASLRIKNPEILKYFGMGNSKKGYTPAKISKKYQINEYIDILKDEDADDLSKATANEMLNNNIQKLAELAIYQESMKGMPDGIPDFVSSLLPEMAGGGFLDKMQVGGYGYDISEYKRRHRDILDTYNPAYREELRSFGALDMYDYMYPNADKHIEYSRAQRGNTDALRTEKANKDNKYREVSMIKPISIDTYYFNNKPYKVDPNEGDYKSGDYVFIPFKDKDLPPIFIDKNNLNNFLDQKSPYKHYTKKGNIDKYLVSTKPGAVYKPPSEYNINGIRIVNKDVPSGIVSLDINEPNIIIGDDGKYYFIEKGEEKESYYHYPLKRSHSPYNSSGIESPERYGWHEPKTYFNAIPLTPVYDNYDNLVSFEGIKSSNWILSKKFTDDNLRNAKPFDPTPHIEKQKSEEPKAQQTKKPSQSARTTSPSSGFTRKPIKRDGGVIGDEFNTSIFSDILARDKYLNNMDVGGEYFDNMPQSNIDSDNGDALEARRKELAEKFKISESFVVTQEEYENYKDDKSELYILGDFTSDIKKYHGKKPMFKYCSGNAVFPNLESAETQVVRDVGGNAVFPNLESAKTQVVGDVGGDAYFESLRHATTKITGNVGGDVDFSNLESAESQVVGDVNGSVLFWNLKSAKTKITGNVGVHADFSNLQSAETQVTGDVGGHVWFWNLKSAKTKITGNVGGDAYFDRLQSAETQVTGNVGGDAYFNNLESATTQVVGNVGGNANFESLRHATAQVAGNVGGNVWFDELESTTHQVVGNVGHDANFDKLQSAETQVTGNVGGNANFYNLKFPTIKITDDVKGKTTFSDKIIPSQSQTDSEIIKVTDKEFFENAKEENYENLVKKDNFGNKHIWDKKEKEYYGFISPDGEISYQWDSDRNYYHGFYRKGNKRGEHAGYHPPVITKEMQEAVKESYEYIKNTEGFNNQIDNDEKFRNLIIKEYRASFPEDDISDEDIIENLKRQQIMAVTHDLMYNKYYSDFLGKDSEVDKRNSVWDGSANANNKFYKLSANQFGIPYEDMEDIERLQRSYAAFHEASHSDEGKELYGETKGYWLTHKGAANEKYVSRITGEKVPSITQVDGVVGNTQILQYGVFNSEEIPEDKEETIPTPDKPKKPETPEFKPKDPDDKEIVPEPDPTFDTWFAPDIMNYLGAVSDKINRYEPSQSKVNLVTPGYSLLDPTRQLAANQESMARYQHMLENSVDPQIALSAALASSGEGAANAANILANVENANVGIVNQAYQQNAAIENSEIMANENARAKYIAEMATLNENMDKAKNLKKWRVINAFNRGWHNFNKDQMMENVLFPQVHTDNITGEVRVKPGRSIEGEDLYVNPMFSGSGNGFNAGALYQHYLEGGLEPDVAMKLTQIDMNSRRKRNSSYREAYADTYDDFDFGENPNEEFGGVFNINDYINL